MDTARYPVELIDIVFLANGERVLVRPVLPQDADVQGPFFSGLSDQSRYNRFLNPMRNFPPGLIERFSRVDHRSHVALIAETMADGVETVVGEARYIVDADGASAEFAIAVADAFQGAGLGTLLLNRLICIARHAGLKRLTGETLATNEAMIALARKAGFDVAYDFELMHLKRLTRDLTAVEAPYPCHQTRGREVRAAA
jgi:acetyltransferase